MASGYRGGDSSGAQSIERSVALLLAIAKSRSAGARLTEVVSATGMKHPTARRLLLALIRAGLVDQDEKSRRYFLGPECYALGNIAAERYGIHTMAMDSLQRLAELSQDTVFITVRNGAYGVCLERQDGSFPIRSYVLAAGDRHPLGVGAGALAILAALPDAEISTILSSLRRVFAERYPTLSPGSVHDLVALARMNGYALNPGLVFPGSWGVGVPVRDPAGRPIAALSIGAIESRMTVPRQEELAAAMREEARLIERRLQDRHPLGATVTPSRDNPAETSAPARRGDKNGRTRKERPPTVPVRPR
jgi:DNA-binding IclR family transcriptional regulator